ncbi:MAG: MarC family protein [Candidatus Micrarchaeota archaeon]
MINELIFAFISLTVVYNPFSKPPQIISVTEGMSDEERKNVAIRATSIAWLLGAGAAFFGYFILQTLDIQISSFKIFGGVILLIYGAQFGLGFSIGKKKKHDTTDVAIVPLATPLLTGPGGISALMLFTADYGYFVALAALTLCLLVCFIFMWFAKFICDTLNEQTVKVVSRLMGMILVAIAVQFIFSGLGIAK